MDIALEHNNLSSERCINYDPLVNSLAYEQSPRLNHRCPGLTHRPRALLGRAMGGWFRGIQFSTLYHLGALCSSL